MAVNDDFMITRNFVTSYLITEKEHSLNPVESGIITSSSCLDQLLNLMKS